MLSILTPSGPQMQARSLYVELPVNPLPKCRNFEVESLSWDMNTKLAFSVATFRKSIPRKPVPH